MRLRLRDVLKSTMNAPSVLAVFLLLPGMAVADVELPCNISFAEELADDEDEFELDLGRIDDFCECKVVTPGFSRYIQARSNFADILSRSTDLCPEVASAVTQSVPAVAAAAPVAVVAAVPEATATVPAGVAPGPASPFARLASLVSTPVPTLGGSRCTVNSAMTIIGSGELAGLCECDVVTLGFVRYLQTRPDVGDILDQTAGQCSDLAVVLSETPVAAIFNNRYIASDPRGAAPGTCSESVCGAEFPLNPVSLSRSVSDPEPDPVYANKLQQGSPGNRDGRTPYGPGGGVYSEFDWDGLPDRKRIR